MISQPRSSMNSCTLASISRSRTPGFSHSYLIFHMAASPMLDACLSSSISSRVFTVRAFEMAGQPLTILRPAFWNASNAGMSRLSMPMFSLSTPCSLRTSTTLWAMRPAMYGTAPSAHCQVMAGRMRPSIHGRSIFAHCRSEPAVSNSTGSPLCGSTQ